MACGAARSAERRVILVEHQMASPLQQVGCIPINSHAARGAQIFFREPPAQNSDRAQSDLSGCLGIVRRVADDENIGLVDSMQEGKSGLEDASGCGVTEPLSTASPSPTASAKSSKNGASNGKPKTVDEAIALYAEEQAFHSDKAGRLTTRSTPPRPAARYSSSETIRQERRAAAYDHRRILLGSTGISGRAGRLGAGRIYPQQTRYADAIRHPPDDRSDH